MSNSLSFDESSELPINAIPAPLVFSALLFEILHDVNVMSAVALSIKIPAPFSEVVFPLHICKFLNSIGVEQVILRTRAALPPFNLSVSASVSPIMVNFEIFVFVKAWMVPF